MRKSDISFNMIIRLEGYKEQNGKEYHQHIWNKDKDTSGDFDYNTEAESDKLSSFIFCNIVKTKLTLRVENSNEFIIMLNLGVII